MINAKTSILRLDLERGEKLAKARYLQMRAAGSTRSIGGRRKECFGAARNTSNGRKIMDTRDQSIVSRHITLGNAASTARLPVLSSLDLANLY